MLIVSLFLPWNLEQRNDQKPASKVVDENLNNKIHPQRLWYDVHSSVARRREGWHFEETSKKINK